MLKLMINSLDYGPLNTAGPNCAIVRSTIIARTTKTTALGKDICMVIILSEGRTAVAAWFASEVIAIAGGVNPGRKKA
jgi:hypothetical protein